MKKTHALFYVRIWLHQKVTVNIGGSERIVDFETLDEKAKAYWT